MEYAGKEYKSLKQPHQIILEERKKLFITGVQDVDCFDEYTAILFTNLGKITVHGKGLHVDSFNMEEGEFSMEGDIDSLEYAEDNSGEKRGFLAKLFK